MYIEEGRLFLVIKFAAVSLYLDLVIKKGAPVTAWGKWTRPIPPAAARYYRNKRIVLSYMYSSVGINTQRRIFGNIPRIRISQIAKMIARTISPKIPTKKTQGDLSSSGETLVRTLVAAKGSPFSASFEYFPIGPDFYPQFGQP